MSKQDEYAEFVAAQVVRLLPYAIVLLVIVQLMSK
jgi:hypothetical protein